MLVVFSVDIQKGVGGIPILNGDTVIPNNNIQNTNHPNRLGMKPPEKGELALGVSLAPPQPHISPLNPLPPSPFPQPQW